MPIHKTKNEDFFKIWSSDMAYVLGFFAADGSMYQTNRGTHFIEFQITDGDLLEEIRRLFGSNHKITIRRRAHQQKLIYRLQIGSKTIFQDLAHHGFTQNKSKTMLFPDIPNMYLRHFVRGYFDGDGCVHMGHYWRKDRKKWKWQLTTRFNSGSRIFLEDLQIALKPFVVGGRIAKKKGGYDLVFAQHDSVALFRFMYDNSESEVFLKRKFDIFRKAFKILNMRP